MALSLAGMILTVDFGSTKGVEGKTLETLGEALPNEIERCQELLVEYRKIPPASGAFAAAVIEQYIKDAHKAMVEQDLPEMIRAYVELKGCQ